MTSVLVMSDLHGIHKNWFKINDLCKDKGYGAVLNCGDSYYYDGSVVPHYLISGNHEHLIPGTLGSSGVKRDLSMLDAYRLGRLPLPKNLFPLSDGVAVDVCGLRVAGVNAVPRATLAPGPAVVDYLGLKAFERTGEVDVLLLHEVPRSLGMLNPLWYEASRDEPEEKDLMGLECLDWVIDQVNPKVVLCGHHHVWFRGWLRRKPSVKVCVLEPFDRAYYVLDSNNLSLRRVSLRSGVEVNSVDMGVESGDIVGVPDITCLGAVGRESAKWSKQKLLRGG